MNRRHWRVVSIVVAVALLLGACAGGKGGGLNLQNVDIGQLAQNLRGLREVSEPEEIQIGAGVTETLFGARPLDQAMGEGIPCPTPTGAPPGTQCTRYTSTSQTPVMTLIHTGGHVYPPWASEPIVKFFKAHKHP